MTNTRTRTRLYKGSGPPCFQTNASPDALRVSVSFSLLPVPQLVQVPLYLRPTNTKKFLFGFMLFRSEFLGFAPSKPLIRSHSLKVLLLPPADSLPSSLASSEIYLLFCVFLLFFSADSSFVFAALFASHFLFLFLDYASIRIVIL